MERIKDMKTRIKDIQLVVSWREFANTYFHKSSSWFYHKMNGVDGNNGAKGGFTPEELSTFRNALYDLSDRIRKAADSLKED